jgi:DivIVA domain-containing protein
VKKKKKDEFETGLEDGSALSRRPSLTASDVQAQEFRTGLRGYNEKDVDAFLDRITEEFEKLTEENQRLRGGASLDAGTEIGDAARAAEEIRSKARQEAAAILAAANAQAGGGSGIASSAPSEHAHIAKFISSEKVFLENLADLIRGHAETVKSTVRDAQAAQTREAQNAAAVLAEEVRSAPAAAPAPAPAPQASEPDQPETSPETWPEASTTATPTAAAADEPFVRPEVATTASPGMSIPPAAADPVIESAWSATTSPAAPVYSPPPAVEALEPEPQSSAVLQDDVISIPPSEVDTPMQESLEPVEEPERATFVADDSEQPTFVADEPFQDSSTGQDSEPEAPARQRPEEERSLRELFWGEE